MSPLAGLGLLKHREPTAYAVGYDSAATDVAENLCANLASFDLAWNIEL